jgi:1-acyl-sn-glycerol-3-phosphate acyltransferase
VGVRGSRSAPPECLTLFGADCSASGSNVCRTSDHGQMVVTCSPRASAGTRANEGIGDRTEEISSRSMPDADLKSTVYKDERPKEYFDRFHERTRGGPPGATYEVVRAITVLHALTTFRAQGIDSGNVPAGPLILAPNHASHMDHFFTAAFIRRRIQFMAKSQLFGSGPMSWVYSHGGVFPVRRGDQDEEAFTTAFRILDRGGAMVMYCEGTRSRTGKLAASAKPGVGRLALESGAPVVPVAILGSHKVRNWKRMQFPKVTVQYGTPFKFDVVSETTRDQRQEAADYIFDRIKDLHSNLERRGHRAARRTEGQRADVAPKASVGPDNDT